MNPLPLPNLLCCFLLPALPATVSHNLPYATHTGRRHYLQHACYRLATLAAKDSFSCMIHKQPMGTLTCNSSADNIAGAVPCFQVKQILITENMPEAVLSSSPAQLGNNWLFFSVCCFYVAFSQLSDFFPSFSFKL